MSIVTPTGNVKRGRDLALRLHSRSWSLFYRPTSFELLPSSRPMSVASFPLSSAISSFPYSSYLSYCLHISLNPFHLIFLVLLLILFFHLLSLSSPSRYLSRSLILLLTNLFLLSLIHCFLFNLSSFSPIVP